MESLYDNALRVLANVRSTPFQVKQATLIAMCWSYWTDAQRKAAEKHWTHVP